MQTEFYSIVGIIALLIYGVINYDVFKHPDSTKTGQAYRRFLLGTLFYYITDALWGFLALYHQNSLLYIDSVLYCAAVVLAVLLWCQYVNAYLNVKKTFRRFLKITGIIFCICAVAFLTSNHYYHNFFWIDSDGGYHTDILRYASMGSQIFLFTSTVIVTLVAAAKSTGNKSRRYRTISLFGMVMNIGVILQFHYPLLPFYTMGLLIGNCILHVFVQEDEKDEIRLKLQENTRVIAAAGYGIWKFTFNEKGEVRGLIGNQKWKEIFGVANKKMSPEETFNYYNSRLTFNSSEEIKNDYDDMRSGAIRSRILEWNHPEKGTIYLTVGGTQLVDSDGTVCISGFIGDITADVVRQQILHNSLDKAREQAEKANQAKSRFLFNMSHDIRTPMNAIIGFTNLLKENSDDIEKRTDYLNKIQDSSNFLLTLINNVLEVARIESGKATLDVSLNDTDSFIQGFKAVFEEQMRQKEIDFSIDLDIQHPYLYTDALKIREIYLNIISNAYKYTMPGGKVSINIKELPSDKEGYCTYVGTVSDTGIGMSKEFLPKIFDEFSREKTYTANKIEGTGLGMPIVKKYLDLMGGSIEIESELNKGTTVKITTTHRIADKPQASPKEAGYPTTCNFQGKRVLLTEDNDLNAEIAIEILNGMGIEVERACDGIECLDLLGQKEVKYYDAILMDIQMPNMDGYKATECIRQMASAKSQIPILAMTANAFEEDKREALRAGMNGHLAKPINIQELRNELVAIFN